MPLVKAAELTDEGSRLRSISAAEGTYGTADSGHGHGHGHSHGGGGGCGGGGGGGGGGHGHSHDGGHGHAHGSKAPFSLGGKGCGKDETGFVVHRATQEEKVQQEQRNKEKLALKVCIALCVVFMIVEVVGGYLANSLAIMTDAAHLLTDVASLMLSLWAINAAERPVNYDKMQGGTKQLTFGWHRAEVLGTLGSIVSIWFLTAVILWEAVQRSVLFFNCAYQHHVTVVPDCNQCTSVDGKLMTVIGGMGLAVNLAIAVILKVGGDPKVQHAHSHGEGGCGGHSHGHGSGATGSTVNVESAFLHALSDCLNSAGVIIASVVIWAGNSYEFGSPVSSMSWFNLADPACSFFFSIITIKTTYGLAMEVGMILMEACPPGINYYEVLNYILDTPEVAEVHDLHIWSLTRDERSLSVHVKAATEVESPEEETQIMRRVLTRVQTGLAEKYNILHSTVQVEVSEDCCTTRCHDDMHGIHAVSSSPVDLTGGRMSPSTCKSPTRPAQESSEHGHSHGGGSHGHAHGGESHGHAHGGESHGHSHGGGSHGHSHGAKEAPAESHGHGHSHGAKEAPAESHGHGHSHGHGGAEAEQAHGHAHGGEAAPAESHGHAHGHSHGEAAPAASHGHAHGHSHGEAAPESHGHAHGAAAPQPAAPPAADTAPAQLGAPPASLPAPPAAEGDVEAPAAPQPGASGGSRSSPGGGRRRGKRAGQN